MLENKSATISFNFDEVKGIFTGYASVFNEVDRVRDTIDPSAYDDELKAWKEGKQIPINFEHNKSYKLADNITRMETDQKGLLVEWKFSEEAKALYPDIWHLAVSKAKAGNLFMSIGYTVLDSILGSKRKTLKNKSMQPDTIYKLELDHIAATDNPVDTKAKILEVKGFRTPKYPIDLSDGWDAQEAQTRWREYTKSTEKPSEQYKNGFLYIEDGREDLFGSYHFQVVDIIDGEPMINQRAVIAANGYLHGARRGVKILNEQEKSQAINIIATLYKKINRLRKEEGIELLPEIETKSEEVNLNFSIKALSGKVAAKRFLKEYKSELSNTNIENFVDQIFNLSKEFEPQEKALPKEVPAIVDNSNDLDTVLGQVFIKLNHK